MSHNILLTKKKFHNISNANRQSTIANKAKKWFPTLEMEWFCFDFSLAHFGIEQSMPVLCIQDACVLAMDQPKLGNTEKFKFQIIFGCSSKEMIWIDGQQNVNSRYLLFPKILCIVQTVFGVASIRCRRFYQNGIVNRFDRAMMPDSCCHS